MANNRTKSWSDCRQDHDQLIEYQPTTPAAGGEHASATESPSASAENAKRRKAESRAPEPEQGTICPTCEGGMLSVLSCLGEVPTTEGVWPKVPALDPSLMVPEFSVGTRCGDCGAAPGMYHHTVCDEEQCPVCGGQLIACGHLQRGVFLSYLGRRRARLGRKLWPAA